MRQFLFEGVSFIFQKNEKKKKKNQKMVLVFLNRMTNVKEKNEKCYISQMFSNS